MSDQEHQDEEREETVDDLDVPEEEAGAVEGGANKWGNIELKRGIDEN